MDGELGRPRCRQGAEGTEHDEPAVGERDTLRGKPQDDRLETGHQRDGDTEADQGASEHQREDTIGEGEDEGPDAGDHQQGALDETWTATVEEHAERQLHGSEDQKVDRCQKAEIGRRQPEFGGQITCDQGVDRAEQVREVVAAQLRTARR